MRAGLEAAARTWTRVGAGRGVWGEVSVRRAVAVGVVVVVVPVRRRVAREAEVLRACAVVLLLG